MTEKDNIDDIPELINVDENLTPKQKLILQSAIEVFSEKGYAAASTNEIAKKAGVAEGTIFRHYATKKKLLISIVMPLFSHILAPTVLKSFKREVFDNGYESFEGFLRVLIKNRLEFARKNLPLLKILIQEMAFQEEFRDRFQKVFRDNIYGKFKDIIKYYKDKGELVDWEEDDIIRYIISTIVSSLITKVLIMPPKELDDEKFIDQTIRFIISGLKK
ncbi:MAG: TetR family transcriptional regulator [Bacillales bacterium]|nr:TetR family transcriptional regulator [Bacillales bacterium]